MQKKNWFVYILQCKDGSFYTGITTNIKQRVATHNSGKGAKYTRARLPVAVVYSQKHQNRSTATKREIEIKKLTRKQKEELLSI